MHQALQIPELVELICYQTQDGLGPAGTLAALARTSRVFQEPALNALWCDQTTFAHILRCMPRDLWNHPSNLVAVSVMEITRPISPADWERPLFYLSRIRSLSCVASNAPSEALFEALTLSLPTEHFFPNLIGLSVSGFKVPISPYIRTLLGPMMTDISIDEANIAALSHLSRVPTLA
ncbi:hypothetical protein C8R44DRAFT_725078 [Mycena epipterygia]|nr:hypothetical protein C8R44DRAFT_725078 [Mycena epipterygia]